MPNLDPKNVRKAQDALNKVSSDWLTWPGVISVEVARRWKDAAPVDELGIRVTMDSASSALDEAGKSIFPNTLEGTPVDVVEGSPPAPETE